MKSIKVIDVPMSGAMQGLLLRVRITGVRVAFWRLQIGALILKLASRVIGCQLEIDLNK